ncbi:MAG: tRNA lysidine(34) synthetase TilS [Chloroflexi bacterium HGW-Chloroflexi-10]|nr:MAG: tRNA lysidine(34) synthetase TilS [Chloroflexi bacterium HGW-Chloroflexi-10]
MDKNGICSEFAKDLLSENGVFVVGVSGGADSICLLHLLVTQGVPVFVGHYHHGLREEADQELAYVKHFCEELQVPFRVEYGDVANFSKQNHLSIEEAARICRYRFLFSLATENNADAVIVAHHADDQVETVLMHFFRGSGLSGLTGMRAKTVISEFNDDIPLIRPLLTYKREEIEQYCEQHRLKYFIDQTNRDVQFYRNQLRNEIIPYLAQRNPGFQNRILNMTTILQAEEDLILGNLENIWCDTVFFQGKNAIGIDRNRLMNLHKAFQRRMVRKVAFELDQKVRDFSFATVERVLDFIHEHTSGKVNLENQIACEITDQVCYFYLEKTLWLDHFFPQIHSPQKLSIQDSQKYKLGSGWVLVLQPQLSSDLISEIKNDEWQANLDADSISTEYIEVRIWRPGERFLPFGMSEKVKVSDYFANKKLLKSARTCWPILSNLFGDIIWIPGYRIGDRYKITDQTRNVIRMQLIKE